MKDICGLEKKNNSIKIKVIIILIIVKKKEEDGESVILKLMVITIIDGRFEKEIFSN